MKRKTQVARNDESLLIVDMQMAMMMDGRCLKITCAFLELSDEHYISKFDFPLEVLLRIVFVLQRIRRFPLKCS